MYQYPQHDSSLSGCRAANACPVPLKAESASCDSIHDFEQRLIVISGNFFLAVTVYEGGLSNYILSKFIDTCLFK